MTKKISGEEVEKLALEYLKEKYPDAFIEGPPVRVRWMRRDYFGLFDYILAFSDAWPDAWLLGVQVSKKYLSEKPKEFQRKWEEWPGLKLYLRHKDGKWIAGFS